MEQQNTESIKHKYNSLKEKYSLPDFKKLDEDFDIICKIENNTDTPLREVRKAMVFKFSSLLNFVELMLNPASGSMFHMYLVKGVNGIEKELKEKRQELKKDIDELLVSRLANYGIVLSDVSIIDIKFSDEFNKAIEAKQVAEQEAKQAIFKAEQAKNDAVARVNMAEGQAKAQQLQQQALSPELLQKMAIDKWDGRFPTYMGTTLPFLQIK